MIKKILLIVILLSTYTFSQPDNGEQKQINKSPKKFSLFAQVQSNFNMSISHGDTSFNYKPGASFMFGLEYFLSKENFFTGLGAGYQFQNNIIGTKGNYKIIPVYFFGDITLFTPFFPRLSAKLGYNFLIVSDDFLKGDLFSENVSSKGGLFYEIGLSKQISEAILFRMTFARNEGRIESAGRQYLLINEKLNLGINIIF
jgi:hypothetical protein